MAYSRDNVFFWWPDRDGKGPRPGEVECAFVKWNIDYKSDDITLPEPDILVGEDMEFPRIDERRAFDKHSHVFFNIMDKTAGTDMRSIGPVLGGMRDPPNSERHI